MKPILARMVCIAIGLAAFAASSGCASSGSEKEPVLDPAVTGRTKFISCSRGYRVAIEVEVEQKKPYVQRGHSWDVKMWTSNSTTDVLDADHVGWIMMNSCYAARPALRAGRSEVEFNDLQFDVPRTPRYFVVVVQATEMTGGEHPEVCGVVTHAMAFDKAETYPNEIAIPRVGESEPPPHAAPAQ